MKIKPAADFPSCRCYNFSMCRNIKQLRTPERSPTDEEIALAALQFVRKVSGYRKPSRANEAAFDEAVADVAAATRLLFDRLETPQRQAAGD